MSKPAQTVLPRWRGFNLTEMCGTRSGVFVEDDFRWIAELGFDFVRLPLNYRMWTDEQDVYQVREPALDRLDSAVALALENGLHVSINFHRAPGYCVNGPEEPFNLWKDEEALAVFLFHWELIAKRFRHVSGKHLSLNPVNEPKKVTDKMSRADYERVMRAFVGRVRAIDPDRLIIIDGLRWGQTPLPELMDLGAAQSCRCYWPHSLSHYKVPGIAPENPLPASWPCTGYSPSGDAVGEPGTPATVWDRARLEAHYAPWAELARSGAGVHCGEGGCFKHTPHDVFLRWFTDVLEILTGYGIGYALWNFRGSFGVLDSEREDVAYEDWHGHKLDRKLLELLQRF